MVDKSKLPELDKDVEMSAYDLLERVCEVILEEPKRYDQGNWLFDCKKQWDGQDGPACGTVGCVAGWIGAMVGGRDFVEYELTPWPERKELDLNKYRYSVTVIAQQTLDDGNYMDGLFSDELDAGLFAGGALDDLADELGLDDMPLHGTKEYAELGAKHIHRFMKKHEEYLRGRIVKVRDIRTWERDHV